MSNAPVMTEEDYLESRLNDQIEWHDRKSGWNQQWYKWLQILTLVSAGLIPFVSAIPGDKFELAVRLVVAGLGVVVAIAAGVQGLYRFQERWIEYRTTSETLKHEKFRYLTRTEPYDGNNAFAVLVERTEGLISQQNTRWQEQMAGSSTSEQDTG